MMNLFSLLKYFLVGASIVIAVSAILITITMLVMEYRLISCIVFGIVLFAAFSIRLGNAIIGENKMNPYDY